MKTDVVILLTDDNKGLYSIYEESGQAIEFDFESFNEAKDWCVECGYNIVDSFNF